MQIDYKPPREKSVTSLMYIGDAELDRVTGNHAPTGRVLAALAAVVIGFALLGRRSRG